MKATVFLTALCICAGLIGGQIVQAHPRTGTSRQLTRKTGEAAYVTFSVSDVLSSPAEAQGRLIRVTAEVVSVDASRQLIRLYDARTRQMLAVSIAGLPRISRHSLINNPVMSVSVFGRAELRDGRVVIDAHKVVALVAEPLAQSAISE